MFVFLCSRVRVSVSVCVFVFLSFVPSFLVPGVYLFVSKFFSSVTTEMALDFPFVCLQ